MLDIVGYSGYRCYSSYSGHRCYSGYGGYSVIVVINVIVLSIS